jgi:hypothetical protein
MMPVTLEEAVRPLAARSLVEQCPAASTTGHCSSRTIRRMSMMDTA